jgi:hypothetical protein
LNNVIQDLLLSRWGRDRKVRLSLDLPDLSNDACTLIEQSDDLLVGGVYLLSAGGKSSFGVWHFLAVTSDRAIEQEWNAGTATQDCNQNRCHYQRISTLIVCREIADRDERWLLRLGRDIPLVRSLKGCGKSNRHANR